MSRRTGLMLICALVVAPAGAQEARQLFAYTSNPGWGGAKVRIPLEDDAVVTERGVEWLYPANQRLLLIK